MRDTAMEKVTRKTSTSITCERVVLQTYEYEDLLRERDILIIRREHEIALLDKQIKETEELLAQCKVLGVGLVA